MVDEKRADRLRQRSISELHDFRADDVATKGIVEMEARKAQSFIESQKWCKKANKLLVGKGLPGKFMSFFIEIEPSENGVPREHWVVCGDVPSAYICAEDNRNAYWAIANYILVMDDWVEAVRGGGNMADCFPIDVPATREWADRLAGRLEFMSACLTLDPEVPADVQEYLDKQRRFYRD